MSEKKKNIFDNISQKLREGEVPVPKNEWSMISKKISFWNFFLPKVNAFNIYYLAAAATATAITVNIIVKKNNITEPIEPTPIEDIYIQPDTSCIQDTLEIYQDIEELDTKIKEDAKNKNIQVEQGKEDKDIDKKEVIPPDIIIEGSEKIEKSPDKKKDIKYKNQYLYQSDTVVVNDTIEKKVRKKKFKFGK